MAKRTTKIILTFILLIVFASVLIMYFHLVTEDFSWSKLDYEQKDLKVLILENDLDDELYHELFLQTGLGKDAVDTVIYDVFNEKSYDRNNDEAINALIVKLSSYQKDFFVEREVECEKIGIITFEEHLKRNKGNFDGNFNIPDLRAGDIVITKNTHSLGWRHGHSGLVIDGENGKTLEAVLWGEDSTVQDIDKWKDFPTFILLRPKAENKIDGEEIVAIAKSKMKGITYGLFTGIPFKYTEDVKKTQCAHLIWYPYFEKGIDIDYDGGWLVTPKDIANSGYFDVVQVYGVNPEDIWP